ncbi:MAG: aldo/keto reductase [Fimbriimonadaceae bacterium]|nr:aldo/keto reductase [Fimbriimonadaceae bacterium]
MQCVPWPGTDLAVSPLCLGTADWGTKTPAEATPGLLAAAWQAGINFFDTAHVYAAWVPGGGGRPERLLGQALRAAGVAEQAIVATKGGHPGWDGYPREAPFLSERQIRRDLSESLERLERDWVDVYYLHRDDGVTPVAEILGTLNALRDEGRIRVLGASNWSLTRVAAANAWAAAAGRQGFRVVQPQWSLAVPRWTMQGEPTTRYVLPREAAWYAAHDVVVAAWSATANGWFAGRGAAWDRPVNRRSRARARQLAAELGGTPTQVALAWLRQQAPLTIPIFSTGSPAHLAEAVGAVELALTVEQCRWLRFGR